MLLIIIMPVFYLKGACYTMKNDTAIENTLKSVFKIAIINIIFGWIILIIITRNLNAFNSTDFTVNLYRYGTLAFIGINADLLRIAKKGMKEEKYYTEE